MKEVLFKDVAVGSNFRYEDKECQKIPEKRISCCKRLNAIVLVDNTKVGIKPLTKVRVDD
jgi:hypothetical protein